ncbi:aldehyde dehydrogenase family protein [Fertoebacter nigrum]|uniref:Aldehyde dehydrogenase family protein n=2 Tax=Fertoeibacter niger TaxID=2656921 RepID=A0A8X8KLT4_9RHOB|nr:aldehyde dehydrogenase family protein [Fertoeibacter niger]NUB45634.1 aldehyde dehydrogenase family protein [Fertoeibacter niger]
MLIGGELVEAIDGAWIESINPADETVIGRVPRGSAADAARAVEAANAAFPAWAAISVAERATAMRAFAARISDLAEEFLRIEVLDTGNTVRPMRHDVKYSVDSLDYYAGLGYELKGETIPASTSGLHLTLREPYGAVVRITPFNHPLMFAVSRTAAALAAGNTVIVKPSETSPLSTALLAEVARETLPPGVFNIVTGLGGEAGDALVRHPGIRRIAFTGSVPTGMAIQRAAAEVSVKRVSLELGGKNPFIAFPDCDPDEIAQAAVRGMNFTWQGQSCGSTSRLLVHESLHDAVVDRVAALVDAIRVGDPMSEDTDMGPINSAGQYRRVMSMIQMAKDDGARLVSGGARPAGSDFTRGYWVRPTVFAGVEPNARIAQQEVFGPVLSVIRWRTVEEAIAIANSTEFGLTAAIWTHDIDRALSTARQVQSGHVWINDVSAHYPAVPFGGYRNSGVGNEESIEELFSYTLTKAINISLRG